MAGQEDASFGAALKDALKAARTTQAKLAEHLDIDPGQVSRWATNKAVPHAETVAKIEAHLSVDLSDAFIASAPTHELYVSAPITGLGRRAVRAHHDSVAQVVESLRKHVNTLYWPGEEIADLSELRAADIAAEHNMAVLPHCSAFLFLQFAEVVHPTSSLIELGIALGRKIKTTIMIHEDLQLAYMLDGFAAVAAGFSFLPKARIYPVHSVDDACDRIERNGRELLGLS